MRSFTIHAAHPREHADRLAERLKRLEDPREVEAGALGRGVGIQWSIIIPLGTPLS